MLGLFGCTHPNTTFPITKKPGQRTTAAQKVTGTYIVCNDCGKEFPYDWNTMRVVTAKQYSKSVKLDTKTQEDRIR